MTAPKQGRSPAPKQGSSLVEYAREIKRSKCKVCQVPDELRMEIVAARNKKIGNEVAAKWLKDSHGLDVTADELKSHQSGNHDAQLRALIADA